MKKTYINPVTELVVLSTGCHICIGSTNTENPTNGLDDEPLENGGNDPGDFSRRKSQWDADTEGEEF